MHVLDFKSRSLFFAVYIYVCIYTQGKSGRHRLPLLSFAFAFGPTEGHEHLVASPPSDIEVGTDSLGLGLGFGVGVGFGFRFGRVPSCHNPPLIFIVDFCVEKKRRQRRASSKTGTYFYFINK